MGMWTTASEASSSACATPAPSAPTIRHSRSPGATGSVRTSTLAVVSSRLTMRQPDALSAATAASGSSACSHATCASAERAARRRRTSGGRGVEPHRCSRSTPSASATRNSAPTLAASPRSWASTRNASGAAAGRCWAWSSWTFFMAWTGGAAF